MLFPKKMDFWSSEQIPKKYVILPLVDGHPVLHMFGHMVAPVIPREQ
jgi:hypothetical protein